MKCLRCLMAVTLCLLVFLAASPLEASADGWMEDSVAKSTEVPVELKEYAAEVALPFIKGWLRSSGKVGVYFETEEEIDQLQVGALFKICQIKPEDDFGKISTLSDALYVPGDWMMLACTPKGEVKWYALIADRTEEGKGYVIAREGNAATLGQALDVFETINRKNGLDIDPTVIWYNPYEMLAMEVVDGKEYVITAVLNEDLDRSYQRVTDFKYLPTGTDAIKALREVLSTQNKDDKLNFVFGDSRLIRLTASKQPTIWETPAMWFAVAGGCVVSVGAVCLIVIARRKLRMTN